MVERQKVRAPDKPPSMLGMGPYTKGLLYVALVGVGFFAFSYGPHYVTEYEAKSAAKRACNDYVREIRQGVVAAGNPTWEKQFLSSTKMLGIKLGSDQYEFSANVEDPQQLECTAEIAFEQVSPWPFISDFFDGLEPIRTVHRISFVHKVKRTY